MAQLDKLKITALTWDSDKDPTGFYLWMENMSSLVRATAHGAPLETMTVNVAVTHCTRIIQPIRLMTCILSSSALSSHKHSCTY